MPFLEKLTKKDLEVLYLLEPIDEVTLTNLSKYKDFSFVDVTKEELEFPDAEEEKEEAARANEEFAVLSEFMKNTLGDKVQLQHQLPCTNLCVCMFLYCYKDSLALKQDESQLEECKGIN